MILRLAGVPDVPQLAAMNARLIQDEGHRNVMATNELVDRMRGFLSGSYAAVLAEDGDGIAMGYALFRDENDFIYIRQLFVEQEQRRCGVGRAMVDWISEQNPGQRLRIDVLAGNDSGAQFWRAMGFQTYCLTMER